MIKTLIKTMYSAFISVVLISVILAGWTTYAFLFQSSKSSEIATLIEDIYASQMSFAADVIDLSKILIIDTSEKITKENKNVFVESDLLSEREEDSQLYQLPIVEDNGDNPLGIVIQPSFPEGSEESLPEIIEETLVNEQNEFLEREMEMN